MNRRAQFIFAAVVAASLMGALVWVVLRHQRWRPGQP